MPNITKPAGMSKIWSTSGTIAAPADSKIAQGWVVELPPYQTANFIENKQDQFNAHANMHGVPVWDGETEYQGGLSYTKGSNGTIYKCIQTNVNSDPTNPLNSNNWSVAFEPFGGVAAVQTQLNNHISNYVTLAGLTSASAARNNLSVWSRSESDVRYAAINGSTARAFSVATATLGHHAVRLDQISSLVPEATEGISGVTRIASSVQMSEGANDSAFVTPLKGAQTYLRRSLNLSDLVNVAAARANLGLGTMATEAAGNFLRASNNLSDLPNTITARSNLGLTSTATRPETYFLRTDFNLSDIVNVAAARSNLGLGGAALLNVGTGAGTVAAGNDARIVNAVQTSRTITAGNGLTGGGSLAANQVITLGTPGSINATSTNAVTATSHTHAIDINGFFGGRRLTSEGYYTLPGGFTVQWGTVSVGGGSGGSPQSQTVDLQVPFQSSVFGILLTYRNATDNDGDACHARSNGTLDSFFLANQGRANSVFWVAIGV